MPKLKTLWPLAALAACVLAAPVSAQYAGPAHKPAVKEVAEILKNPVDDEDVVLQGHILRQVGDEEYVFSDGTGEIVVEIDDDDFPRDQTIDDKVKVELTGEVDTSRKRPPEIDVDKVRVLK